MKERRYRILENDEAVPCETCGDNPLLIKDEKGFKVTHTCELSHVTVHTGYHGTIDEAVETWNRRV